VQSSGWVHAIIGTRGSWLPEDPRGFRDHDHREHSSGDYRQSPSTREHAGPLQIALQACPTTITIPAVHREEIAEALAGKPLNIDHLPRIIGVRGQHAHFLLRVVDEDAKPIVGRAKQSALYRVTDVLLGALWAQTCHVVRIHDQGHYRTVVEDIAAHAKEGASVWSNPDLRKSSGHASTRAPGPRGGWRSCSSKPDQKQTGPGLESLGPVLL